MSIVTCFPSEMGRSNQVVFCINLVCTLVTWISSSLGNLITYSIFVLDCSLEAWKEKRIWFWVFFFFFLPQSETETYCLTVLVFEWMLLRMLNNSRVLDRKRWTIKDVHDWWGILRLQNFLLILEYWDQVIGDCNVTKWGMHNAFKSELF